MACYDPLELRGLALPAPLNKDELMTLTGRFNFRKSRTGKIILQVEEERQPRWSFASRGDIRHRWRDARSLDLALPALRGLVELRDYVQDSPQANYGSAAGFRARRRWEPEPHQDSGSATPAGSADHEKPRSMPGTAQR